ncbi:MAG: hydantoin utilization protein A [Gemmatimonadota bacterium]|nr:hydantoin utilization protein A [Gemmatimonadota bacterium]MDP6460186.1 hydantoin utilization protein A [Gemmatimonadota bacterium]MDP6528964.1 hydantoin utilization protein A [Gemmatimonadota bacterium]MDP6802038.1 hydantoin utilization protein A [Gemmatimonadota bacterium]MDP7031386.1 hydantoin utilization protein A [Gemmatimonadota bacterium]
MPLVLPFLSGLAAGSLHVVSGPDHLGALAPMAAGRPARAVGVGLFWGFGHGTGVVLLGLAGVLGRSLIDVDAVSGWSERIVGVVLVAVGLWAIRRSRTLVVHAHGHKHLHGEGDAGGGHEHIHVHLGDTDHARGRKHSHRRRAAWGIGVLHGAAGTGHLVGVVPSLALPAGQALVFLSAYLVAATVSMGVFAGLLGSLTARLGPRALRPITLVSGLFALAVGVVWMVRG